jgi:Flp pilus assembly protein TadD
MEHYLSGLVSNTTGDTSRALTEINLALQADPNLVPALIQNGSVLAKLRRFDAALASYRRALQLDGNSPSALNAYAWLIADILPQPTREQLEDAGLRSQRAVSILADPNFYDTQGWVQFKLHNYQEAKDALERAREEQQENPLSSVWQDINFHLAMTYLRLGRNTEAKKAFQQVVDFGNYSYSNDEYVRQAKGQLSTL